MKKNVVKIIPLLSCFIFLCACGQNFEEGIFAIDCPIEGLQYETDTETGETDKKGTFQFKQDEMIQFFLGDIQIGKSEANEKMTPFDLAGGARNLSNQTATNMFRLFISLDKDFSLSNGIQISSEIIDDFKGKSLNFAYQDALFEKMVNKLKPFSNEGNYVLCSVTDARYHMKKVLNETSEKPVLNKLHGLFFSPYLDNQDPNNDDKVLIKTIFDRMGIIKKYTNWIRSDGCTNGMESIGRVAKDLNINAALGARITDNSKDNIKEIDSLIREAQADYADIAIVGSYALSREDIRVGELIKYIQRVKDKTQNVKITYADTYDIFLKYPQLVNKIDLIFLNFHPFKQGIHINDAIDELQYRYNQLISIPSYKPIYISETGWPFDGVRIGNAVANEENAKDYLKRFVQWAQRYQIKYFYFEAFDEQWRSTYDGLHGAHWGLWKSNGLLKTGVHTFFQTASTKDLTHKKSYFQPSIVCSSFQSKSPQTNFVNINHSLDVNVHTKDNLVNYTNSFENKAHMEANSVSNAAKTPEIIFTHVPPYGNRLQDLRGRVFNVNPDKYIVIVCCQIMEDQIIMPNRSHMATPIQKKGQWTCDITGKQPYDWKVTKITAFLVPVSDSVLCAKDLFERDYSFCEIIRNAQKM